MRGEVGLALSRPLQPRAFHYVRDHDRGVACGCLVN